jgi:ATP/maltotriose-dependent transcriptional regulator MalT/DNA-binding SARP family transcriptional activator
MPTSDHPAVDTVREPSVSFPREPSPDRGNRLLESQVPVSVVERTGNGSGVDGYPVQPSKVQCPPLREETLARNRLLDWLAAKIHHRVVFVVAEAGYGKTTLLADFSRRTRLRTLWYRLDNHDRDWLAFLSHLVAAGREHDPGFAEATQALLHESGGKNPTRETVTAAFLRDVKALGGKGAVFVFDDYHTVDESPDVKSIVGELVAHAPERVTFVFASRRQPSVRVARLRALGEVAELSTDDLRFSKPETEQLFRETYGRPLDRDVLGDLSSRTEGWAASLQLVQAALRDRSAGEVRTFVRSLTGAEGDLYDYLAEEVIGELPDDLQAFLMKVAVLETVDPQLAASAAEVDAAAAGGYLAAAEKLGVLGRRGRAADSIRGFHPLVRDFLRARLAREAGEASVTAAHLRIARASEEHDWSTACFHYAAAGQPEEIHRVLRASLRRIIGTGQFQLAASYLERYPTPEPEAGFEAVRARSEFQSGRRTDGVARAERALILDPDSDAAGLNLMTMRLNLGDFPGAMRLATEVAGRTTDSLARSIATASAEIVKTSVDGDLSQFVAHVTEMADEQGRLGMRRYEGISLLNAAAALKPTGAALESLEHATRAVAVLEDNGAADEIASAHIYRIWALAHLGRLGEADADITAVAATLEAAGCQSVIELARIRLWYGDPVEALRLIEAARRSIHKEPEHMNQWRGLLFEQALRDRRVVAADRIRQELGSGHVYLEPGSTARGLALEAYLALLQGRADTSALIESAIEFADRQGAFLWSKYGRVIAAAAAPADKFCGRLRDATDQERVYLSILAELVVDRLDDADDWVVEQIAAECLLRPTRWRAPLRGVIDGGTSAAKWRAAHLLDEIGEGEDVGRLRKLAKSAKGRPAQKILGKLLARKLAPRVFIEDEGRVTVRVGDRLIQAGEIRRKVLALLCFLVSRHGLSATRDQVLDALWPDLEPTVALNSLNQTVYFLRRVFEPDFSEELSPGYLQHDSNVLWLDTELVSARSTRCWDLVKEATTSWSPSAVEELASSYVGKFALDFAYEEWAIAYRDSLHAAYLQVIETAVARDTGVGAFDRAIDLARRALMADPDAEQIEISLLRLYRLSGAHSAAAEQYAHYANVVRREIGVEPPGIEMV